MFHSNQRSVFEMGSCISKCKPKKSPNKQKPKEEEECKCIDQNNPTPPILQDKLVISQASIVSPTPSKNSPISSLSPSNYTTTSSSSSSCSSLSTASSSASSTSSSIPSSKLDRSFSNEYLFSCVKENPQIILPNYPIKVNVPRTRPSLNSRRQTNHGGSVVSRQVIAQKRSRCSSPTPCNNDLTRQKSFRREAYNRAISPSPSRRFRGEMVTPCVRRESGNIRPRSPSNNNNFGSKRSYSKSNNLSAKREKETNVKRVEFKMEELELGKLFSGQDMDWMPLEDVNNPHIALDCFIFL